MKYLYIFLLISVNTASAALMDLRKISMNEVIGIYFDQVDKNPYVICPEVLSENRTVSIRASEGYLTTAIFNVLLDQNGYEALRVDGVYSVCTKKLRNFFGEVFVYDTKYRSSSELVKSVKDMVSGTFGSSQDKTEKATSISDSFGYSFEGNQIVFSGSLDQVKRLKWLLSQIDVPRLQVNVEIAVFELTDLDTHQSALQAVGSVFGNIGIQVGSLMNNHFVFDDGNFAAAASVLDKADFAEVISHPHLMLVDGSSARLHVGDDIPVQGQIVYNDDGQVAQSIEYKQSGLILNVSAKIRKEIIRLKVSQEVSSFFETATGNPRLSKRQISSDFLIRPGQTIVLAGLSGEKESENRRKFLGIPFGKTRSVEQTQLVVMIHAEID